MISWWLSKEKDLDIKEFNRNSIKGFKIYNQI